MEGWRQRRLGLREQSGKRRNEEERRKKERKNERTGLTLTGLLMEVGQAELPIAWLDASK
jgi:hypothetical protein